MKKFLIFIFHIFIFIISYCLNFSIAPTNFNLDFEKDKTQEVYVINNTSTPLRIETYVEDIKDFEKYGLKDSITIFPKIISIKPGVRGIVRFRIKEENFKEDGEYRSLLIFKEIPKNIKTHEIEEKDISTKLDFITEIGVPVSVIKGKSVVDGFVSNVKINYKNEKIFFDLDLISKGNTALKLYYEILEGKKILSNGKLGTSKRNGKKHISESVEIKNLKGKNIKIILKNQNDKIIY